MGRLGPECLLGDREVSGAFVPMGPNWVHTPAPHVAGDRCAPLSMSPLHIHEEEELCVLGNWMFSLEKKLNANLKGGKACLREIDSVAGDAFSSMHF